jgi:hypothetical protein
MEDCLVALNDGAISAIIRQPRGRAPIHDELWLKRILTSARHCGLNFVSGYPRT